jgi:hypothetical protein
VDKELALFIRHWKRADQNWHSITNDEHITRFDKTFKDGTRWYSFWNWGKRCRYTILDEAEGSHYSRQIPIELDYGSAYREAQRLALT